MGDLLSIRGLTIDFDSEAGAIRAVDGIDFSIRAGETVGLVGESGCGKSVTALSLVRLLPEPPARIRAEWARFEDRELLGLDADGLRALRGARIGMIFQDPMSSLSPLHRIGEQLVETLRLHRTLDRGESWRLAEEWLRKVGIPDAGQRMWSYPHELSGGMRQRVMIAMSLMLQPALLIADEPTTALDVTVQAQVFALMRELKSANTALLLITHDLGVIWEMCDRVLVMYAGAIVEEGRVETVFRRPRHPYTAGLMRSMPRLGATPRRLPSIRGQVPAPGARPAGCLFADRCDFVKPECRAARPRLEAAGPDQRAACVLVGEGRLP